MEGKQRVKGTCSSKFSVKTYHFYKFSPCVLLLHSIIFFLPSPHGIPAPCPQVAEDEFLPQHIDLRRFWLHARKLLRTSFYRSTLTSGISFCFFHDNLRIIDVFYTNFNAKIHTGDKSRG
ncbi:hypothetical protein JHK85_041227 [Glycine max]|nr:hypothetical protein JHK86_040635 [Glycine max]KAG4966252.1 hypothetical protein JHK85_041227 [Glycine max]